MACDYDLVVIGGTRAGLQAATQARGHQARVALVITEPLAAESLWATQALAKFTTQQVYALGSTKAQILDRQAEAKQSVTSTVNNLKGQFCPAYLAGMGIDVVWGSGQFYSQPGLQFEIEGRQLRSRAYLIASDRPAIAAQIPGLSQGDYLTSETWVSDLLSSPLSEQFQQQHWLVIAEQPWAIESAQMLARLGQRVTLLVSGKSLLPQEDSESVAWLQAQLEAEGIAILTAGQIVGVQHQSQGYGIEVLYPWGNSCLSVDRLLLSQLGAAEDDLNLRSLSLRYEQQQIWVNAYLQTSHPQIYVCGDRLGGYSLSSIALHEASLAVHNALNRFQKRRIHYQSIAWGLGTDPEWARVGLNKRQAEQLYPGQFQILKQTYNSLDRPHLLAATSGFCQLVVHRNGLILGATIWGTAAIEIMSVVALAIQQRLKISALEKLASGSPTLTEIVFQTASQS